MADAPMINAKQTPCVTGFQIGWCDLFDRSAWSVPAGFPEPYLYDRLLSGSDRSRGGLRPLLHRRKQPTESVGYFQSEL